MYISLQCVGKCHLRSTYCIPGTSLIVQLVKNLSNAGDPGSIPGLGRSTGDGIGYPLQYSGLKNSMDCVSVWVHKETQLSDFHFHFTMYLAHALSFLIY